MFKLLKAVKNKEISEILRISDLFEKNAGIFVYLDKVPISKEVRYDYKSLTIVINPVTVYNSTEKTKFNCKHIIENLNLLNYKIDSSYKSKSNNNYVLISPNVFPAISISDKIIIINTKRNACSIDALEDLLKVVINTSYNYRYKLSSKA